MRIKRKCVEGFTAWLYDCFNFHSTVIDSYICFEIEPSYCKDTLMNFDPLNIDWFFDATPISCDEVPKQTFAKHPDTDDK